MSYQHSSAPLHPPLHPPLHLHPPLLPHLFVLPHLLPFHLVNVTHLLMLSIMANGTKSNGKIAGKEVKIVYRLLLVNCYLLHVTSVPKKYIPNPEVIH